jgi:hypothetical protein
LGNNNSKNSNNNSHVSNSTNNANDDNDNRDAGYSRAPTPSLVRDGCPPFYKRVPQTDFLVDSFVYRCVVVWMMKMS